MTKGELIQGSFIRHILAEFPEIRRVAHYGLCLKENPQSLIMVEIPLRHSVGLQLYRLFDESNGPTKPFSPAIRLVNDDTNQLFVTTRQFIHRRGFADRFASSFGYQNKDAPFIVGKLMEAFRHCGIAALQADFGTAPYCDTCPNQLRCLSKPKITEDK